MRIYLDANIVIYLVEGHPEFFGPVRRLFNTATEQDWTFVLSDLCRCECLIGAARSKNPKLLALYEAFFEEAETLMESVALHSAALESVPDLAAQCGLKLVDAMHLSLALQAGCDGFATNDRGFEAADALIDLVELD